MSTPFFFPNSSRNLFGLYQPPVSAGDAGRGVLICPPGPQEQMYGHRSLARLAALLAAAGFHVLRFDYSGTGDSSGNAEDYSLEDCREDVAAAARELKEISGVNRLAGVGMRLGGTFLALACRAGLALSECILWDPVVLGSAYLAELEASQRRHLSMRHARGLPGRDELCGVILPNAERQTLAQVDLREGGRLNVESLLVVCSEPSRSANEFVEASRRHGTRARYEVVPDPEATRKRATLEEAVMSTVVVRYIVEALGRPA